MRTSPTLNAIASQRILCFGDSITQSGSWLGIVAENASVEMVNGGLGGRKAAEAKSALTVYLDKYPNLDRIIMLLGVNDLPARDKRPGEVKVAACVACMNEAIDLALTRFKPEDVILAAPCGVNADDMSETNLEKGYQITQPLLVQLEQGYRALAVEKGVRFLSLLNAVSKTNYKDGLHPNENGDAEIARAVLAFLSGDNF